MLNWDKLKMNLKMYHTEGDLKGIPTKMHTILMWAYTPDEKIINLSKEINKIKKFIIINKNL